MSYMMIVRSYSIRSSVPRSQTYSANEVDIILTIGEQNETIEWVDIDPEAFTGTKLISYIEHRNQHQLILLQTLRKWRVGHCPSSSKEDDQHTVLPRWPGVPGDHLQFDHPKEAPFLHHQCHPALLAHILTGGTGLLPTCTRSESYSREPNTFAIHLLQEGFTNHSTDKEKW